ncbi:putative ATP-dependent peptidase [Emericellopsis atlantica]|uniref:ATP-dependent peptidase n=1 Tax=Emericellopsis atlantica TaxID=2614577 RepID=A0A9P7ZTV1_9HYPO|nr:putative ATP-dependent peptidase [Emericellopsis atlantica]KAG9257538.1 putative ATP-dependent peptidase [Emericellopsis atlantica]
MASLGLRLSAMTPVPRMARTGLMGSQRILAQPVFESTSVLRSLRPMAHNLATPMGSLRMLSSGARYIPSTSLSSSSSSHSHRSFGTVNGVPRNQLANSEANANRDPNNANLQNAFYDLLLRANMPGIVVTRHQSGRYGANAATEELYSRALGAVQGGGAMSSTLGTGGHQPVFNAGYGGAAAQNQHLGMGGIGNMTGSAAETERGIKGKPMHVLVHESAGSKLFRWTKFIFSYMLALWISFSLMTIVIEVLNSYRRPGGTPKKVDSEVTSEKQTARFTDVHGCNEAKEELEEVVEFLKHPDKFSDLGAKLPKGVLLVGPPGTGKTLLARAVAGEAGVPFFYMSGSEFDEIYVGVGAKRVRELFSSAKAKSPAIVFIDELDAIGGKRNPRDQAHSKQTLNQLLTELDGFDQDARIIIIAATNTPNMLDKALTRPGRFDRHVSVDLPDVRGRIEILKHHAHKVKLAPNVDLEAIAARSPGRSGAELENMLNVAALKASRAKATMISRQDMEWAFDRVTMGSERKSMVITEKEKEMTAYHEAGHALVQLFDSESSSNLYKVTILPKGMSLGHTAFLPQMDKYSHTAAEYLSSIRVSLGGKMAEELRFGDDKVTSGVSQDLESATDLCFSMVSKYGMSHELGPVEYGKRYEYLSSDTRAKIESEVQKTLKKSYEDVRQLLTDRRKELDLLAQALVRYETLDKEEVMRVIKGESLPSRTQIPPGPMLMPVPKQDPLPPGVPQPTPPEPQEPPAAAGNA